MLVCLKENGDFSNSTKACCLMTDYRARPLFPSFFFFLASRWQTIEPNGELGFSMVFQSKMTPFKRWVEPERVQKYVNFFGPGVDAEVSWTRVSCGFLMVTKGKTFPAKGLSYRVLLDPLQCHHQWIVFVPRGTFVQCRVGLDCAPDTRRYVFSARDGRCAHHVMC